VVQSVKDLLAKEIDVIIKSLSSDKNYNDKKVSYLGSLSALIQDNAS